MTRLRLAALLAPAVLGGMIVASSAAHADWRHGYGPRYGGYGPRYGGGYWRGGPGPGAIVGGALLGLGVGALLAAPAYAPPPVVYAPPPAYYPPPAYAYAPAYAPPPYYAPPGYYPR